MADEAQYSSGTDTVSNKRKYEDQPPPMVTRRPTGFSGPITSPSSDSVHPPPPSYNNVPPPMDEIQLAKQRAQEIASRLIISSGGVGAGAGPGVGADVKRPRVENGGGFDSYDKGFSSGPGVCYFDLLFSWIFLAFVCLSNMYWFSKDLVRSKWAVFYIWEEKT